MTQVSEKYIITVMKQRNNITVSDSVSSTLPRYKTSAVELPVTSVINRSSNQTRYSQGAELIKDLIRSKGLKKGTKLPSIRTMADHLSISPNTVCRVLQLLENEGAIYRVHGSGTFVNSDMTTEYSILCLIDHFYPQAAHDSYIHDIIAGNQHWFSEQSHHYMMKILGSKSSVPLNPTAILGTPKPAGIVLGTKLSDKWIRVAHQTGLPTVMLNRHWSEGGISAVVPDNQDGAEGISRHLWALGHRRVAVLCSIHQAETNTIERRDSVVGFWNEHGAGEQIKVWNIDYTVPERIDSNYDFALMDIIGNFKPTAIIGCNDYSAWHAYQNIKRIGLRIPEDISVVGFQDLALASQLNPGLTTVRVDTKTMGILAAEHIDRCIQGKERPGQIIRTPLQLIIRDSTAEIRNYI